MITINKTYLPIIGAICGDILGSQYERRGNSTKELDHRLCQRGDRFTDDTVCTVAIFQALRDNLDIAQCLQHWCRKFPDAGYGRAFRHWIASERPAPYNSFGNGSAMRVSAAATMANSLNEALELAEKSAVVTHNHPEGIKGAQAVAAAIWMAMHDASKDEIKNYVEEQFGYNLHRNYDEIRAIYKFDSSCQGSVPESIICFLEGSDYEDVVRHAIALGGDADTMAAIAGSIAAAFYKQIPEHILLHCQKKLTHEIKEIVQL